MKDSEFNELVSAFIDGEVTPAERRVLLSILRDDPRRQYRYESMMRLHQASVRILGGGDRRVQPSKPQVLAAVSDRTFEDDVERASSNWFIRILGLSVAASIALTAGFIISDQIEGRAPQESFAEDVIGEGSTSPSKRIVTASGESSRPQARPASVEEIESVLAALDTSGIFEGPANVASGKVSSRNSVELLASPIAVGNFSLSEVEPFRIDFTRASKGSELPILVP